ncbi:peptidoglycan-binding protein [Janibacter sp. GXQ6167]|uniref:L,D-transpeptidase family protein n=1 Tax=Janibacter sp. GXQ6167 TaxID=3240791 RepID=UPI003523465F
MMLGRRDFFRAAGTTAVVGAVGVASAETAHAARPTLRQGSTGSQVKYLQARLRKHGYWCRSVSGTYDDTTQQAVMAVQKAFGLPRDGVCGPKTWARIERLSRVRAKSSSGTLIEIDKRRQLMIFVVSGKVTWVFNTSTGTSRTPTPSGRFRIFRQINGWRRSRLGLLYRPKYFNGGIALHGSKSIPGYPASHGCCRLSNRATDYIWWKNLAPIGRRVWVY